MLTKTRDTPAPGLPLSHELFEVASKSWTVTTCSRPADCQLSGLWIAWTHGQKEYLSFVISSSLPRNQGHRRLLQQHCRHTVYTKMNKANRPKISAAAKVSNDTLSESPLNECCCLLVCSEPCRNLEFGLSLFSVKCLYLPRLHEFELHEFFHSPKNVHLKALL